jgi:uncharacterized protein YmfQ (DUF2313 family)
LKREAIPGLSRELLPEWEETLGLPDQCSPLAQSLEERAQVAHAKYISVASAAFPQDSNNFYGQSTKFFKNYAKSLGADIDVKEFTGIGSAFRVDVNRVDRMPGTEPPSERIYGSRLWSIGSKFKWIVTILNISGDVSEEQIKCRIRQLAPAHTEVTFR